MNYPPGCHMCEEVTARFGRVPVWCDTYETPKEKRISVLRFETEADAEAVLLAVRKTQSILGGRILQAMHASGREGTYLIGISAYRGNCSSVVAARSSPKTSRAGEANMLDRLWPSVNPFWAQVLRWSFRPQEHSLEADPALVAQINTLRSVPSAFSSVGDYETIMPKLVMAEALAVAQRGLGETLANPLVVHGQVYSASLVAKRSGDDDGGDLYSLGVRIDLPAASRPADDPGQELKCPFYAGQLVAVSSLRSASFGDVSSLLGVIQPWDPVQYRNRGARLERNEVRTRVFVCAGGGGGDGSGGPGGWISVEDIGRLKRSLEEGPSTASVTLTSVGGPVLSSAREAQAVATVGRLPDRFRLSLLNQRQTAAPHPEGRHGQGVCRPSDHLDALVPSSARDGARLQSPSTFERLWANLALCYNESQMAAIRQGSSPGLTLIQGPPGTGKTRVISGILAAVLAGSLGPGVDHLSVDIPAQRVLIVAPSNAAADELVHRVLGGVLGVDGAQRFPRVVRIGSRRAHQGRPGGGDGSAHRGSSSAAPPPLLETVRLDYQVQLLRNSRGGSNQENSLEVLLAADVVVTTMSGAASRSLIGAILLSAKVVDCPRARAKRAKNPRNRVGKAVLRFDAVIMDEAAQASETSTLIALRHHARAVIMVGDPKQLPATLFSEAAKRAGFGRSLFERLQRGGHPVVMLNTQYRMHPAIRIYCSELFYNGSLRDAPSVGGYRRLHREPRFGPFLVHDVSWGRLGRGYSGSTSTTSLCNRAEVEYIIVLLTDFEKTYRDNMSLAGAVGIITPYANQVLALQRALLLHPRLSTLNAEVATVDAFQGREKSVVIMSCVRAPEEGSSAPSSALGFVADPRRLNVSISRARDAMWIVCHAGTLSNDRHWRLLLNRASRDGNVIGSSAP